MRISVMMMIALIVMSVGVDLGIYKGIKRLSRTADRMWIVTAVACWIWLVVTLCLPRREFNADILRVMWSMYAYMTVYAAKIMYGLGLLVAWAWRNPVWKRTWRILGIAGGLVVVCLMIWGATAGRRQIDVREVTFESPNVPEAFDGYRIVQFSDAHVGTWGSDISFITRLVDSIQAVKPNLILFTGDIVNRKTDEIFPFIEVFGRLNAPDGVYSVMGNHDYGDYCDWPTEEARAANIHLLHGIQEAMGWKMLNNANDMIIRPRHAEPTDSASAAAMDTLVLIGVENWGEPPFKQYGQLDMAYPLSGDSTYHFNDDRFKILMTHNPEHWRREVVHRTNVDLTLSGHTHAMQMTVGEGENRWSPAEWRYEEWGGMFTKENPAGKPLSVYVNIGCGEVGMPFRIGAAPEITIITLRRK